MIRPRNLPDFIGALLSMALGCAVSLEAYRLSSYAASAFVGDHTLPFLLGISFIVLGLVLLVQSCRPKLPEANDTGAEPVAEAGERTRLLLCLGVLFLYAWLLEALGYFPATLIASFLLFRLIGFYRLGSAILLAVLLTGGLYGIFIGWLQITFPTGFLLD